MHHRCAKDQDGFHDANNVAMRAVDILSADAQRKAYDNALRVISNAMHNCNIKQITDDNKED